MGKIRFKLIITYAFCLILLVINTVFISEIGKESSLSENNSSSTNFTEVSFSGASETITRNLLMAQTNSDVELFFQPSLTFLTHGLGAAASIWSNDGTYFQYNPDSMIESLRLSANDAIVYLAKVYEKVDDRYIFGLWELAEGVYQYSTDGVNYISQFDLEDLSKHMIIVFESRQGEYVDEIGNLVNYNLQDLRTAYDEFDYVVDSILYEVRQLSGALPKINLIGHNTGGIINLMYAIDHPKIVSSLFSLGTPYNGLIGDGVSIAQNWINDNVINSEGYKNLLNQEFISDLKSRWNAISMQNYNINTFALGGATAYDIIQNYFNNDKFEDLTFWGSKITLDDLKNVFGIIIDKLREIPEVDRMLTVNNNFANQVLQSIKAIGINAFSLDNIKNLIIEMQLFTHSIFNNTAERMLYNDKYLFLNDMFSGLESQLAKGYNGFVDYAKLFSINNCDLSLSMNSLSIVPTVNDISPIASDFIDYIINNLLMVATPILYDYTTISNEYHGEGIRLDGYKLDQYLSDETYSYVTSNYVETLKLPETLMFKTVIGIGSDFGKSLSSNIKRVVLPQYIYEIEEKAFYDCDNIEIVDAGYINIIGAMAFYDCDNLKQIKQLEVLNIGEKAFYNCKNLESFNISKWTSNIGKNAFSRCNNISIKVHEDNYKYASTPEGSLMSKDKTIIYKFSAKEANDNYVVPSTVKTIEEEAFADCTLLSIDINNVESIGVKAFINAENLTNINLGNKKVQEIKKDAFQNTFWLNNYSGDDIIYLEDYLIEYRGESPIIELNDVSLIADYAFYGRNISSISMINDSLVAIGSYSFANTNISNFDLKAKNIGSFAFSNSNLVSINLSDIKRIEHKAFATSLFSTLDLRNAEYIGAGVIDECLNLKEIRISLDDCEIQKRDYSNDDDDQSIYNDENSFNFLNTLEKVYFYGKDTFNLGDDIFANCNDDIEIFVPYSYYVNSNGGIDYYQSHQAFISRQNNIRYIAVVITFDSDSEVPVNDVINTYYFSELNLPIPYKRGYTFIGWNYDGNIMGRSDTHNNIYYKDECGDYNHNIVLLDEDHVLKAKWVLSTYNIRYWVGSDEVTYNNYFETFTIYTNKAMPMPSRRGYSFLGWELENNDSVEIVEEINGQFAEDISVEAIWEANKSKLFFIAPNIASDYYIEITYDNWCQPYNFPFPINIGYIFTGWYDEDLDANFAESEYIWKDIREEMVLRSNWVPKIYNVSYNTDCDEEFETTEIKYDEILNDSHLPSLSKPAYLFIGWHNLTIIDENTASEYGRLFTLGQLWHIDGDLTLYALWMPASYRILFTGFDHLETLIIKGGEEIENFPVLEKEYYVFNGWTQPELENQIINENNIWEFVFLADSINQIFLIPVFDAIEYDVVLNSNGGNNLEPIGVKYDTLVGELVTPERKGYNFQGWYYNEIEYTVDKKWNGQEQELLSQWKSKDYILTFNSTGGNDIDTKAVTYDELVGELDVPIKDKYDFLGWFYGEQIISEDYNWDIDSNIELEAKWRPALYNLQFYLNYPEAENEYIAVEVEIDSEYTINVIPQREGYYHLAWLFNGQQYHNDDTILCDEIIYNSPNFYAIWEIEMYHIKILDSDFSFGSEYIVNDTGNDLYLPYGYPISSNYISTFYNTKEGNIFSHFEYNGNPICWDQGIPDFGDNEDIVIIEPVYLLEKYTINFNTGLEQHYIDSIEVYYSEILDLPILGNLIRAKTFIGWLYNNSIFNGETMPDITPNVEASGQITLDASWETRKYKLDYDVNGGEPIDSIFVEYNQVVTLTTPTRIGYYFIGWFYYNSEIKTNDLWLYENDAVLIAEWNKRSYQIQQYVDNQLYDQKWVFYDSQFYINPPNNIPGYAFDGWFCYENGMEIAYTKANGDGLFIWDKTETQTVYAKWKYKDFDVNYFINNGINNTNNPLRVNISEDYTLYNPNRTGYSFSGWYLYDEDLEIPFGDEISYIDKDYILNVLSNISLYADWEVCSYTITLDENDGDPLQEPTEFDLEFDAYFVINEIPTRTGYNFIGWYDSLSGGKQYTNEFGNSIQKWDKDNDNTLYARWRGKGYLVFLDTVETAVIEYTLTTLTYQDSFRLPIPQRAGYVFKGWHTRKDLTGIKYTGIFGYSIRNWDKMEYTILYAHWEISEYTITYELDGGMNSEENPLTYTIEDGIIVLQDPTKEGFWFLGWKDAEGNYVSYIDTIAIIDITLYAVWL